MTIEESIAGLRHKWADVLAVIWAERSELFRIIIAALIGILASFLIPLL